MKICEFRGGLGNQLFEYAHYLYMKKKYPDEKFYGYYPSCELWCHQGLEIHKSLMSACQNLHGLPIGSVGLFLHVIASIC